MSEGSLRSLLGKVVGERFLLTQHLGNGTYGTVFIATEYKNDQPLRTVAVKLVTMDDSEIAVLLQDAARNAVNLDHPNIIKCYESNTCILGTRHILYSTMELADTSLETRLRSDGVMSELETLDLAKQIGSALAYLHYLGLTHHDLKPANILKVGSQWKLSDFDTASERKRIQRTSEILGTHLYAPPEALRGLDTSHWDMWSLGCTLVECLTGHPPFEADTIAALQRLVQASEPVLPSINDELLRDLIQRSLSKDPNKRPRPEHIALISPTESPPRKYYTPSFPVSVPEPPPIDWKAITSSPAHGQTYET